MTKAALAIVFLLSIAGCSSGVIVHDQTRAAELVVDFLTSLKSAPGIELAYEWTDDSYKEKVSFTRFSGIAAAIRGKNLGADIKLAGYEVFGPKDTLVVYANSKLSEGRMYFRFSLVGTKSRDYYLLNFTTSDSVFSKKGIYREYDKSIVVKGV